MRRFALILALCVPNSGAAGDTWRAMGGAEIRAALEGRVLQYENATQDFRASGKTRYTTNGRDSWGSWRVQGDQYCSTWPPSDLWTCYRMDRQGDRLRFVGERDDITDAVYAD